MSDRSTPAAARDSGVRDPKRRRIDGSVAEDATASAPSEGYPQWHEKSQAQTAASFGAGQGVSSYAAPAAEYNNPHATSALNVTEGTHWQRSGAATYPDLADYQQQPYFYQQQDSSTFNNSNNSSWQTTAQPSYAGIDATSNSIAVREPSSTATMPYFPPSTSTNVGELPDALDATSTFNYPGVEDSGQYAPYGNGAIASLQRNSSSFYFDDAGMHLKIQSLPILDNLATQLIHTISKASFPQIQDMMRSDGSEDGQAYRTLKNLFDQTRKVYSRETPFIDAIAIQMFQPTQQEIIRKANIATFISSILGAHDVSFFHLNEFFMETFVPLGHRLLKWQGAIYLELKTQTYISALMNSDGSPEEMLEELFPPDLDAQVLTRHPDAPSLSSSEQDFIDRSRARKSYLLAEPASEDAMKELPKKYQWSDFVREFASCITKNVDGIMNVPARSQASLGAKSSNATTEANGQANGAAGAGGSGAQNASNKSGDGGKKSAPAASTVRQPWTKPEEDALLSGLERVNGPHWSQILALYGRGGSVSEVLKDRNQVQLKDKARNLKLWYLKTGKEVPPALRGVTGELRKRGGARARAALGITEEEQNGGADKDAEGESGDGDADAQPDTSNKSGRASKKKAKK
ncbi:Putative Homeobox-like domain superfamily, telomere repeat-binding factor, dimerization [Septoria linicola]|uniref:Homeobox-like domain superfamily, telomere repeat-binding factor, dimerization n=1 Tax=Septoria linicola TaxID=215465 RepID=A0A9Q9AYE1_9PEZI|nr:putative Homeobox-like domain superfamily, telomere repeat-binding factor, dimerization [Septoria linicola]USW57410.1 Putative Homeobox-like domain superfamily, telomere repeat-binding factor, dimerization [Septoria linicola]